jgi:hypothetical protein
MTSAARMDLRLRACEKPKSFSIVMAVLDTAIQTIIEPKSGI